LHSPQVAHYLISIKYFGTHSPEKATHQLYVPNWNDGDQPHRSIRYLKRGDNGA
jgi:hypothetical protein